MCFFGCFEIFLSKYKIDITMPAVIRPKLLAGTLKTIVENVVDDMDRFRLIINVDPIGEKVKPQKVVSVAKKFFPNVLFNIPKKPSFPDAVRWLWGKSTAPFVLHWEDDIDILRKIDINDMIRIMLMHKEISSLRLYKHKTPKKKSMHTFSCKWVYNEEGFYVALDWKKQFGLNPILIRRAFIDEAVKRMVSHTNPEKQFRFSQNYMRPLIQKWKYAIYTKPGWTRLIDGRKGQRWKNRMHLQKPKGQTFLVWEKR